MINRLLEYKFIESNISIQITKEKIVKSIIFNSFDHDNYKKDKMFYNKNKGYSYYGKKRRYYTDYC